MLKKIFSFILEPLKIFSHRGLSEKISSFLTKHPYIVYIGSLLIVIVVVFFSYK